MSVRAITPRLWEAPIGWVEIRRSAYDLARWQARRRPGRWPSDREHSPHPLAALRALQERTERLLRSRGESVVPILDDFLPLGETGVRSLRDQCAAAGTSFAFKGQREYRFLDDVVHDAMPVRP